MSTDLRVRYRMRQERIAAGLPAPPVVTMTSAFLTSNPLAAEQVKCSECDIHFTKHGRQITCSKACYGKREKRLKRSPEVVVTCDECRIQFTTTNSRAVVCGEDCRTERRWRQQREWEREHGERKGTVAA